MRFWKPCLAAMATILVLSTATTAAETNDGKWLPASPEKLPRWRGFNLLEKFLLPGGRKPFVEKDFQLISKLGFNFVRLPMDYRFWIKDGNCEEFDEPTLREIDQAVEWGRKYGIHVCINFHRAPGYTVASPPEKTSLWTDPETQRVCAKHWGTFARRYKGIPSERLSFNLMNEPANVQPEVYLAVVRKLVDAIRAEDPSRLIISDGLQWGQQPLMELREMRVAQATRGYTPMEISHYKANWIGDVKFPEPQWPRPLPPNGILMSPSKPEGSFPLVIDGPFALPTLLRLRVQRVSVAAQLIVEADGKKVLEKAFKCGPGEGEWKKAEFNEQYKIYQNLYDRDYTAAIPTGTKQVQVRVTSGDWLEVSEVGLSPSRPGVKETKLELSQQWGKKPEPFRFAPGEPGGPILGLPMQDRQWLWKTAVQHWKDAQTKGCGVMVGEWGAFNKTPHDVVLRWAEDSLANWKEAGFGWALWNFRGSFGILDSGREDVEYEAFEGHKLDRKFLELLQRY